MTTQAPNVSIASDTFRYEVSADGVNVSFVDLASGIDYVDHDTVTRCARVTQGGATHESTAVSRQGNTVTLKFGDSGLTANLLVTEHARHVDIQVESVEGGGFDKLEFLSVPLTLRGKLDEPFGACALALDKITQVGEFPALQPRLSATCYLRFGIRSHIALVGVPPTEMLVTLREIIADAPDLPSIRTAGAWAQGVPFNHGSYLFNFGTLTEETVDEWIEMVHSLGFNQIDNHGGGEFFTFGDLRLNPDKWPDGWDSYKRIVARLHEAGIASIFHTYSFFVDKNSEFVTPVPSPHLDAFRTFTLSRPIDADADTVYVNESTADISTITGFMEANSITLHIGDELINFGGATKQPPYAFTGCTRGAYGTTAAPHSAGEAARHLKEYYGVFAPDCESPLFAEIARRHAEIVDYCDFDGIYFDAIDGAHILRGHENGWYWGQQFVFLIYQQMKKPISMEMSAMWHQVWNLRSRFRAWDYPVRGYKRFIDMHIDEVTTTLLLPLQLGWWNFHHYLPPQTEPHYVDVMDYIGSKLIGYNAGLSLTGAVSADNLREIPLYRRLVERLKVYEKLRHSEYFAEPVRARLRELGKEFSLVQDEQGQWRFRPAQLIEHKVTSVEDWSSRWQLINPYAAQPLQGRIAALISAGAYDLPENPVLADLARLASGTVHVAQGVQFAVEGCDEQASPDLPSARLTATSAGEVEQRAAWARVEIPFEPTLDLSQHQGLGVWIYGDGNGELLAFRLQSPHHLSYGALADRNVTIDFTGWRYYALVETESARWSDYDWDGERDYYGAYRYTVEFGAIESLSVWLHNLPAGKTVSCCISPIVALPLVTAQISNPTVTVNGAALTLPITMTSGEYVEIDAAGECVHYGPKGETLGTVQPAGEMPEVHRGANAMAFATDTGTEVTPRVSVMISSHGEPL